MNVAWCSAIAAGIRLTLHCAPNARKSEVIGVLGDALKIRLQAPALEGRANDALIRFLAAALAVPKSAVTITHGQANKHKVVEIVAPVLTPEMAAARLLPAMLP